MEFPNKVLKGIAYCGYVLVAPVIFLLLPAVIVTYFVDKSDRGWSSLDVFAAATVTGLVTAGWIYVLWDMIV